MSNNQNRNNQNRKPRPQVDRGATQRRAQELGAKTPQDSQKVQEASQKPSGDEMLSYLKNPEKLPGFKDLKKVDELDSFEDESLLKLYLSRVIGAFSRFNIDVFDKNGDKVALWDEDGQFIDPKDAQLFDEDGNEVDFDALLEAITKRATRESEEQDIRDVGRLIDILAKSFSNNPRAIYKIARGEDGMIDIIRLASVYVALLGE